MAFLQCVYSLFVKHTKAAFTLVREWRKDGSISFTQLPVAQLCWLDWPPSDVVGRIEIHFVAGEHFDLSRDRLFGALSAVPIEQTH